MSGIVYKSVSYKRDYNEKELKSLVGRKLMSLNTILGENEDVYEITKDRLYEIISVNMEKNTRYAYYYFTVKDNNGNICEYDIVFFDIERELRNIKIESILE